MRMGAWAGTLTPVVWFALLLTAGALLPGYDPVRQYMTELTDSATWPIALADFYIVALLIAVFAIGLRGALGHGGAATAIVLLVLVKALATLGTGLVHGDVDPLVRTPSGQLHNTLVAVGNVALALACLLAALALPVAAGLGGPGRVQRRHRDRHARPPRDPRDAHDRGHRTRGRAARRRRRSRPAALDARGGPVAGRDRLADAQARRISIAVGRPCA